jgi:CRP/FNR family transcriptional regulator, cyclic AMP receptor protein
MGGYGTRVSPRFVPASITELQRVGVLASLPGETLRRLAERMRREEIPPGTRLVAENADDGRFFVLLSGLAAVTQADRGARSLLRPGEPFGEVAATLGIPRTASVTTITTCTVASCDHATFVELVRPAFTDEAGASP